MRARNCVQGDREVHVHLKVHGGYLMAETGVNSNATGKDGAGQVPR